MHWKEMRWRELLFSPQPELDPVGPGLDLVRTLDRNGGPGPNTNRTESQVQVQVCRY